LLGAGGADRGSKFLEKIVGKLLCGAVDQALTKLRELAADLRLDRVDEQGAAVLRFELDGRAAGGEARDAAVALAADLVAVRRIEIGQRDLAPLNFAFTGPILVTATA
jgi:hypothetical protein